MVLCPKLKQARSISSSTLEDLEEMHKLSNRFVNFPGTPYGAMWMSATDAVVEGVWRDHYTGQETSQDVLQTEVGGLKENTAQNCGIVS